MSSIEIRSFTVTVLTSGAEVSFVGVVKGVEEARALLAELSGAAGVAAEASPVSAPAKPAPKAAPKAAPKPAPEPEEAEDEDEDEDDEAEDEDEDDAAEEAAEPEPAKPAAGAVKITADDVRALKETKKLREVLDYLINKKSIRTKKGLIAACNALKEKIPVLSRIEDLDSRVPGAVELFDPTIK
jgi:hypothetical protein